MTVAPAALAPLVRPLPVDPRVPADGALCAALGAHLRLIVTSRDRADAAAARVCGGPVVSRSRVADRHAVLLATGGLAGLDMETIARVALNATPQDGWLAGAERALVERSGQPAVELACHWVLKEAYGKALGVGLDLRLDELAFGARGGGIALGGMAAPPDAALWDFALHRHGDALFGTAYRPFRQTATPLAPAGRKPPTPLPER